MSRSCVLALFVVMLTTTACSKQDEGAPLDETQKKFEAAFHIGVVTNDGAYSEDERLGAEELIRRYGSVDNGGMIRHIRYSGAAINDKDALISSIADDPRMKALIISQAVSGTADVFTKVREKRSDILLFAGEAHEEPIVIQAAADIIACNDYISRAYLIPWSAKRLGSKTIVYIASSQGMANERSARGKQIMEKACKDLGLAFLPLQLRASLDAARKDIAEKIPDLIRIHGMSTVFFCADDAYTEVVLAQLFASGGICIETNLPSPFGAYPTALGLSIEEKAENIRSVLKKIEEAVVAKGGAGRFGTYAYGLGFSITTGLGEFAKNILENKASKESLAALRETFSIYAPGLQWNMGYYTDADTGIKAKNHILIYTDTYLFGKGYLNVTKEIVPEKYFSITAKR